MPNKTPPLTPSKEIRQAVLSKYDEMRNRIPAAQFRDDNLGFVRGSAAEWEFFEFYNSIRDGKVAGKPADREKIHVHMRWHLKCALERRSEKQINMHLRRKHPNKRKVSRGPIKTRNRSVAA